MTPEEAEARLALALERLKALRETELGQKCAPMSSTTGSETDQVPSREMREQPKWQRRRWRQLRPWWRRRNRDE